MARLFSIIFLLCWLGGCALLWHATVYNLDTALQFAWLTVSPTLVLIGGVVLSARYAV